MHFLAIVTLSFTLAVTAAPAQNNIHARASVSALSTAEIASMKTYTLFARAGACRPERTFNWNCGGPCNDLPGFQVSASGGDGMANPSWFVGYYPPLDSVVVSHQGTNSSDIQSILNDIAFMQKPLNPTLFPRVGKGPAVHSGFLKHHETSAPSILNAVKDVLAKTSTKNVLITGHSFGAALATLDGVFLKLNLPSTISIKVVGYGSPRVGNSAFAELVDSTVSDHHRVNNNHDLIPILPGRHLGFAHAGGEIHINGNQWLSCPGRDTTVSGCTIATVPNIFVGNANDHRGPYDGVTLSHHECD